MVLVYRFGFDVVVEDSHLKNEPKTILQRMVARVMKGREGDGGVVDDMKV